MKKLKSIMLVFMTIVLSFSLSGCDDLTRLIVELDRQYGFDDDFFMEDVESDLGESSSSEESSSSNPNDGPSSSDTDSDSSIPPEKEESASSLKFEKGYITSKDTILETEHFIFEIDSNVYVPPYLLENIEVIYDTLELVSGLKFYNKDYNSTKIAIEVAKVQNEKSPEIEFGSAYAYSIGSRIHVASGDLLLGNSYAIVHELAHILHYAQSKWAYNKVYGEGFAEYTSYKVAKYLEEHNIDVAKTIITSKSQVGNMSIHGNIYSQSIEYWIENNSAASEISGNGAYSVGFRFMSYLEDKYGDYTAWINYYENKRPHKNTSHVDQMVIMSEQLNAMKNTYGKDVFDGFYAWLKINEDRFIEASYDDSYYYDLSKMEKTYIFPSFVYNSNSTTMTKYNRFKYKDLYVAIDEARYYLETYKGKDVSNLKLVLEKNVKVELYDSNHNLLQASMGKEFSLVNVSYIKLVGEGMLGTKAIHGLKISY